MQRSGENPWAFFVVTVGGGGDGAATERRVQQLTRGNETISHVARTHLQKRALIPLPQSNSRKSTCGRLNKSNHRRRGLVFQPKPSLVDTGFLGDLQKDRRGVGLSCGHKKRGPPKEPPAMPYALRFRFGASTPEITAACACAS